MLNEHLKRIFDLRLPADYEVSKINVLGYLAITIVWCLPWSLFLPSTLKFAWQQWQQKTNDKTRFSLVSSQEINIKQSHGNAIFLLAIAFLVPIVIFLPLTSRLIYYSIPAIPPYVILCAGFYSQYLTTKNHQNSRDNLSRITKKLHALKYRPRNSHLIYGAIFICLGITFGLIIISIADLNQILLELDSRASLIGLTVTVAITLALGYLISGIEIWRKNYRLSLCSLVISLIITYLAIPVGL